MQLGCQQHEPTEAICEWLNAVHKRRRNPLHSCRGGRQSSYWLGERERFNQIAKLYEEKIGGDPNTIMYWDEERPVLARMIENAVYTPYTSKAAFLLEASLPIFIRLRRKTSPFTAEI